ncbi:MAG TPA: hypothetical protein VD794_03060 [Flavisolibacter sp.]|nr:hypothetical protein [Flavisolibacter sp.]
MNPKIYDIDYNKLTQWMIPSRIRKGRIVAFVQILIYGVSFLYQDLLRFRKQKLYELTITPQVCYLERLLNDRFDFIQRRIRIVDSLDKPPYYIYQKDELKPKYIYLRAEGKPAYIYTSGESSLLQDDFVVLVPAGLIFEEAEMRSLVRVFKLAGKRFKIQSV